MGKKNPFIGSTLEEAERVFRKKDPAFAVSLDRLRALREAGQAQHNHPPRQSPGGLRKPSEEPNR